MTKYYKILGKGHKAIHGGEYTYTPGQWTPKVDVVICESGYHVCTQEQLVKWLYGECDDFPFEVWECSVKGVTASDDKSVCESIRLDRLVGTLDEYDLRWLGTLYAETVLHNADDERVGECLNVVKAYCLGLVGKDELAAARYAAWSVGDSVADITAWFTADMSVASAAWGAALSTAHIAVESAARSVVYNNLGRITMDYLEG